MTPYCVGYKRNHNIQYELYGVCVHMGILEGGHYYTFVKNFKNQWINYDDRQCRVLSDEQISKVISTSAYILFYRQV